MASKKAGVKLTFNMEGAEQFMNEIMAARMEKAAAAVKAVVDEKLSRSGSGRVYRVPGTNVTYTASAPGQPPAEATGEFRKSIKTAVRQDRKQTIGVVGTDHPEGFWLEKGTASIQPRPWLEPSFREAKDRVKQILQGKEDE